MTWLVEEMIPMIPMYDILFPPTFTYYITQSKLKYLIQSGNKLYHLALRLQRINMWLHWKRNEPCFEIDAVKFGFLFWDKLIFVCMRYESIKKVCCFESIWWLSQPSIWLGLRSRSHGSWFPAPWQALCWQLRAWSLLRLLCLPLSLSLPCLCSVSLWLSNINRNI